MDEKLNQPQTSKIISMNYSGLVIKLSCGHIADADLEGIQMEGGVGVGSIVTCPACEDIATSVAKDRNRIVHTVLNPSP